MKEYNTTPDETQKRVISARAEKKGRKQVEKKCSMLTKLEVEYMDIADFVANSWNPNRQTDHDFELLLRSMEEDGFTQPIIALKKKSKGKHIIIDGEHRWRGADTLGFRQIPAVLVDMSEEQARISTMRHNKARGEHDIELEAELWRDLRELGALEWAQDSLMVDDVALQKLLEDTPAPELLAAEEYSPGWVPDKTSKDARNAGEDSSVHTDYAGDSHVALTVDAVREQRAREEALRNAKTKEDQERAKIEHRIYRLSLLFTGNEADIVKTVLGEQPANTLLSMCKAAIGPCPAETDKPMSRSEFRRKRAQGASREV